MRAVEPRSRARAPGDGGARALIAWFLALALVLWIASLLLRGPEPEPPAGTDMPPDATRPVLSPPPDLPPVAPLQQRLDALGGARSPDRAPSDLPDGTAFQRRLAWGDRLLALQADLQAGRADVAAGFRQMRGSDRQARLDLDAEWGYRSKTSEGGRMLAGWLRWLVEPRRDPAALTLHASEDVESPLGAGARLRVWTLDDRPPPPDVASGAALLARLEAVAGDRSPYGYDVLATPRMGLDLFPHATLASFGFPVAGVYVVRDDLCLVGTAYEPAFLQLVLKHELVHAWALREMGPWPSRFLEEGLAEYLSRLEPGDERLAVPPERFADEFAALLEIAKRGGTFGLRFDALSFDRLLALDPLGFYAFGHLGYLLAQAAVARAGGEVVEAALRTRSQAPLAEAIRDLDWTTLRRFVARHAGGGQGDRAVVVDDLGPGADTWQEAIWRRVAPGRPRGPLADVGVRVPEGLGDLAVAELLRTRVDLEVQDRRGIGRFLDDLAADPAGELVVISDATTALDGALRWNPDTLADLAALIRDPDGIRTRADLVERLYQGLLRSRRRSALRLVAWGVQLEHASPPLARREGPVRAVTLAEALDDVLAGAPSLIVCCASSLEDRPTWRRWIAQQTGAPESEVDQEVVEASVRSVLASLLRQRCGRLARVLVVDLADGAGDAALLAQAFVDALGGQASVALWNPQQPLR